MDLKVFVSEHKHTEKTSAWSWGFADSKGIPVLSSVKNFDKESDAIQSVEQSFADWNIELDGEWKK